MESARKIAIAILASSGLTISSDCLAVHHVPDHGEEKEKIQNFTLDSAMVDSQMLMAGHRSHSSHRSHVSHSSHYSSSGGGGYYTPYSAPSYSAPSTPSYGSTSSTPAVAPPKNASKATTPAAPLGDHDKTLVSSIQTKLKAKGYYSGAVDGVYGLQTKRAILLFQIEHGLATVGLPTQDLLSDLDKY